MAAKNREELMKEIDKYILARDVEIFPEQQQMIRQIAMDCLKAVNLSNVDIIVADTFNRQSFLYPAGDEEYVLVYDIHEADSLLPLLCNYHQVGKTGIYSAMMCLGAEAQYVRGNHDRALLLAGLYQAFHGADLKAHAESEAPKKSVEELEYNQYVLASWMEYMSYFMTLQGLSKTIFGSHIQDDLMKTIQGIVQDIISYTEKNVPGESSHYDRELSEEYCVDLYCALKLLEMKGPDENFDPREFIKCTLWLIETEMLLKILNEEDLAKSAYKWTFDRVNMFSTGIRLMTKAQMVEEVTKELFDNEYNSSYINSLLYLADLCNTMDKSQAGKMVSEAHLQSFEIDSDEDKLKRFEEIMSFDVFQVALDGVFDEIAE